MRICDLTRIAIRNVRLKWAALPLSGFAAAALCLCFSGALWTWFAAGQSQPYALRADAGLNGAISDETLAAIADIPGVTAATPLLQLPATLQIGEFSASLTLSGVATPYLEGEAFEDGGAFTETDAMPYIVLNEGACTLFARGQRTAGKDDIDWLNASFSLQSAYGGRVYAAKVCGIIAGGEDAPAAYISLSNAKALFESSRNAVAKTALIRVENAGYISGVSAQMENLRLGVSDLDASIPSGWADAQKEAVFLLVMGALCLLFTSMLLRAYITNNTLKEKDAFDALLCMGMKKRQLRALYIHMAFFVSGAGTVCGIVIALMLPLFFPTPPQNIYFLSVDISALNVIASAAICIFGSIVPLLIPQARRSSL